MTLKCESDTLIAWGAVSGEHSRELTNLCFDLISFTNDLDDAGGDGYK